MALHIEINKARKVINYPVIKSLFHPKWMENFIQGIRMWLVPQASRAQNHLTQAWIAASRNTQLDFLMNWISHVCMDDIVELKRNVWGMSVNLCNLIMDIQVQEEES